MLTIPRSAVKQFRRMLKRSVMAGEPKANSPFVQIRAGPGGPTMTSIRGEVGLRLMLGGKFDRCELAFDAALMERFEGGARDQVTLEKINDQEWAANWTDGGVPQSLKLPTVTAESLPGWPSVKEMADLPYSFIEALAEAVQTAAKEGYKFAVTRVMLRGTRGEVVATNGKELLIQGGFPLPWKEDLLVPRVLAFTSLELPDDARVEVGRGKTHVVVAAGPWSFALLIDKTGRFPPVDEIIPKRRSGDSRCSLHPDDVEPLVRAIPKLTGDDAESPITLDLDSRLAFRGRAAGDEHAVEVIAERSSCAGTPVLVAVDRHHLLRGLKLGFTELCVSSPEKPLAFRDAKRIYLFMPQVPSLAVPPEAVEKDAALNGAEIAPAEEAKPQPDERSDAPMANPNGQPAGNGQPAAPPDPALFLLQEAEAVRDLMSEAMGRLNALISSLKRQKNQTRAIMQAVQSLRHFQLDR